MILRLSSGREVRLNNYIGISSDGKNIASGYDQELRHFDPDGKSDMPPGTEEGPFTGKEREELADYAIALWERFGNIACYHHGFIPAAVVIKEGSAGGAG